MPLIAAHAATYINIMYVLYSLLAHAWGAGGRQLAMIIKERRRAKEKCPCSHLELHIVTTFTL